MMKQPHFWFHAPATSIRLFFVFLLLGGTILSCQNNPLINNKKEVGHVQIIRFDKDLMQFDTAQFEQSESALLKKYPEVFPFYVEQLMGLGAVAPGDNYYKLYFNEFMSGEYKALYDSCQKLYSRLDDVEKELNTAIAHYAYYFPQRKMPVVQSFIISPNGNFPAAFTFGKDSIGINLFSYLGENFTFYNGIYDNYWKKWLNREYIVRNMMLVLYNSYEDINRPSGELIYEMIESGKKMYFLDCVMPELADEIKIGYSKEQLAWCKENEKEIWKFFAENKLLYSLDNVDLKRYTREGPTTPGMPDASPGMVGTWVGWQIVKKYMKDQDKPDLNKLLYHTDAKEILTKAKYKP